MLRVENLHLSYGTITALDGVSLEFTSGSIIALTGPNGSGKSTLLKILAGLLRPGSGRVLLNNREITGSAHPDIGLLLQRPVLLAGSVEHNIAYGLRCRGIKGSERHQRIRDALAAVGSEDLIHRSRRSLSGGEIQRVALARTLALAPRILLLDEPFAHLDTESTQRLIDILKTLHAGGILLIVATHQETRGHALGARILALKHGRQSLPDIENIIHGESFQENGRWFLRTASGPVLEHTEPVEGNAAFYINPGALVVAGKPLTSSARNSLPGRIQSMVREGTRIIAVIDCGIAVKTYLTESSIRDLNLTINSEVVLTFKASALRLCRIRG